LLGKELNKAVGKITENKIKIGESNLKEFDKI